MEPAPLRSLVQQHLLPLFPGAELVPGLVESPAARLAVVGFRLEAGDEQGTISKGAEGPRNLGDVLTGQPGFERAKAIA